MKGEIDFRHGIDDKDEISGDDQLCYVWCRGIGWQWCWIPRYIADQYDRSYNDHEI
jgi:hypothetical protein